MIYFQCADNCCALPYSSPKHSPKSLDNNLKEAECKESHISRQNAPLNENRRKTSNDKEHSNLPVPISWFHNKSG